MLPVLLSLFRVYSYSPHVVSIMAGQVATFDSTRSAMNIAGVRGMRERGECGLRDRRHDLGGKLRCEMASTG